MKTPGLRKTAIFRRVSISCERSSGGLLLISPYVLYFSRYNRHDIYEIAWALLAAFAVLSYLREDDLIVQPIDIKESYAIVPDRAGLGVELDEDAVKKYQAKAT